MEKPPWLGRPLRYTALSLGEELAAQRARESDETGAEQRQACGLGNRGSARTDQRSDVVDEAESAKHENVIGVGDVAADRVIKEGEGTAAIHSALVEAQLKALAETFRLAPFWSKVPVWPAPNMVISPVYGS